MQDRTPTVIWKRAIRKTSWDLQGNKKFGSLYTEVSVERTHSQIGNPAWTSFPAPYQVSLYCMSVRSLVGWLVGWCDGRCGLIAIFGLLVDFMAVIIVWIMGSFVGWFVDCFVAYVLVGWLIWRLIGWLVDLMVCWLVGLLKNKIDWLLVLFVGWFVVCIFGGFVVWFGGLFLVGLYLLIGWLVDLRGWSQHGSALVTR